MTKLQDLLLIMKDVSRSTSDLLKCQVDYITAIYLQTATRLLTFLLLALFAMILAGGGLGFMLWSSYMRLSMEMGPIIPGFIIGILLIMAAIIVYLMARTKLKT